MELVLSYLVGILLGLLTGLIVSHFLKPNQMGYLRIDRTDPDGPYLFLEINDPNWYDKISNKKEVIFKIRFRD